MMTPVIFHIDVNSAYLSWTATEQLKNGAEVDIADDSGDYRRGSEIPPRNCACEIYSCKKIWHSHRGTGGECLS